MGLENLWQIGGAAREVLENVWQSSGAAITALKDALLGTSQWLVEETGTSAAAADEYVYSDAVETGKVVELEYAGMKDDTTACTSIEVGILKSDGTTYVPVEETPSPAADQLYTLHEKITLEAGQKLYGKWTGSVLADTLYLYAAGRVKSA